MVHTLLSPYLEAKLFYVIFQMLIGIATTSAVYTIIPNSHLSQIVISPTYGNYFSGFLLAAFNQSK